jgi:hypothetical protein
MTKTLLGTFEQIFCISIQFIICRFTKQQPDLSVYGIEMEKPEMVSFLCLKVNRFLDWNHQINYLCTKIRKGMYALGLGRLRAEIALLALKSVYFSNIYILILNAI